MDFAFVPGGTTIELVLRRLMGLRPQTTLISKRGVATIADFFAELQTQGQQADDLLLGSHATDEGQLFMRLDSTVSTGRRVSSAKFEDLQKVDASNSIQIPSSVQGTNTNVRMEGCTLGVKDAEPYLKLLKKAMQVPKSLSAPKYFHGFNESVRHGIFEFMKYRFSVFSKTAMSRDDIVNAFRNQNNTFDLDNTAVPDNWNRWVKAGVSLAPSNQAAGEVSFVHRVDPPQDGITAVVGARVEFRATRETFNSTVGMPSPMPKTDADKIAALDQFLSQQPNMQAQHDYPVFQRYHFPDYPSFFKGFTWQVVSTNLAKQTVSFSGSRFRYSVFIPIVEPNTTDKLIFNFYPFSGTPTVNFKDDNAAFPLFGVV